MLQANSITAKQVAIHSGEAGACLWFERLLQMMIGSRARYATALAAGTGTSVNEADRSGVVLADEASAIGSCNAGAAMRVLFTLSYLPLSKRVLKQSGSEHAFRSSKRERAILRGGQRGLHTGTCGRYHP